jgi:type I restriction enzyme R subunit
MATPSELRFQNDIIAALTKRGWITGTAAGYDAQRALYPEDVIEFYRCAHPEQWQKFHKRFPHDPKTALLDETAKNLGKRGTLPVLRKGFKSLGAEVLLAAFKPDHDLNPEVLRVYAANILRVVPEVTYSAHGGHGRLDLVLFVNGLPVATLELKSEFTQDVQAAMTQYRQQRPPIDPVCRKPEPLLTFKRGALVHFAVSESQVFMATELKGPDTTFLPFNRGTADGRAGNPANPAGYDTSYLWERVFERHAWLQILGKFMHLEVKERKDALGQVTYEQLMIFPRHHQWEAVTKLINAARLEGPGRRYLIQHSAGSGKSNSIAWLAHQLASLYSPAGKKQFRSVIVVTDRTVLDSQLQETIAQFEHQSGLIETIDGKGDEASKSARLAAALLKATPIIVVTLQTFPHVLRAMQQQTTLRGEAFAVIPDEAHSSQSGRIALELRKVLVSEQLAEDEELSGEDLINLTLEARRAEGTISYFAFTATPKAKTLELFGRRPEPDKPQGEGNQPQPFHLYSMRQAVEEGFILDVLRNYITYDRAFQLAQRDADRDREVPERKAGRELARFVRLHPGNIAQKVEIIVEHFRQHVAPQLGGQAKAMIVTGGRKDAVRYKLALDAYAQQKGYSSVSALVAFSGDVIEQPGELAGYDAGLAAEQSRVAADASGRAFTESSMNPSDSGDLREAFDQGDYNVLIVANKFQTGFNQPKLVAMYVDKKLSGIDAVQTLSRLNRTYPGKNAAGTFILDFQNTAEDIAAAFRPYYGEAFLASASDPDLVYDLQEKLLAARIFYPDEVDAFAETFFRPAQQQAKLLSSTRPAVDRYRERLRKATDAREDARAARERMEASDDAVLIANADNQLKRAGEALDALELFRSELQDFTRLYEFLSQIVPYDDADLEKLSAFTHYLHRLLPLHPDDAGQVDLSNVELQSYRVTKQHQGRISPDGESDGLRGITGVGTRSPQDEEEVWLSTLIERLNEIAGSSGAAALGALKATAEIVQENADVMMQVRNNPPAQVMVGGDFPTAVIDAVLHLGSTHGQLQDNVLADAQKARAYAQLVLELLHRGYGPDSGQRL